MGSIAAMWAITQLTAYQSLCYSASGFVVNSFNLFWLSRPSITTFSVYAIDIVDMIHVASSYNTAKHLQQGPSPPTIEK